MTRKLVLVIAALALLLASCSDSGGSDCTEGARTTESGLEIEEIECGDGAEVGANSIAVAHYTGMLENGTTFDSSEGGEPVPFPMGTGQMIQGFEEGLRGMKVGGKRRVTIPPELGYGPAGSPPTIPPEATLVFELELIEVQEPPS